MDLIVTLRLVTTTLTPPSRKRRCLNPCPWTSASVERACQGASIENTAALCILWARLIQADESLARTAGQVEAFCHMLRQRQGYRLRGWLEEVEQHGEPELQAFARNLHKEESAVQAGLTLAWSNGPTEGFIHLLFLFYAHGLGWSSRDPRETAATQPS